MSKPSKIIQKACRVLRSRINLRTATLRLPSSPAFTNDTPAIRESMRLYLATWVHPILDAIETGDTKQLQYLLRQTEGELIGAERAERLSYGLNKQTPAEDSKCPSCGTSGPCECM